ncbi:MAG: serine--tRNA ligase [Firmicutes bacterium]|nr:serine--tRNA ligase [Bacillota bacterium]
MIDFNSLKENPQAFVEALKKRGFVLDIEGILEMEEERKDRLAKIEKMRATRNSVSSEIAKLKRDDEPVAIINAKIHDMQKLGEKIEKSEDKLRKIEARLFEAMSAIPNIPADEVTAGGKEANRVVKTNLEQRVFEFTPKDHVELATVLGLINYETGAKMSGSGNWVYKGMGARLEWALLNYFIDFHVANRYEFVLPPHLLNYESGYTAGQFPKFADDVFVTNFGDDLKSTKFLLPTSETALINMHRGENLAIDKLPIKYAAYSPCYRKEAGGYGASERGMIRGHQFNKVEMFMFATAEQSDELHKELVRNAEKLVEGLGLHYQTVLLSAGDTGAAMAKTYDIEVWVPSMKGYKEVSSSSNAHCYQARRANIRTTTEKGKQFVHTLNASGLATSRLFPAILEQFQNADGSVTIPEVLRKYLGGVDRIEMKG